MSSKTARQASVIIAALAVCAMVSLVLWQGGTSAQAAHHDAHFSGAEQQPLAKQVSSVPAHTVPDLSTMNPRVGPGSISPGGNVEAAVLVHYDGDDPAPTTTLRFYRSVDAVISLSDTELVAYEVSFLPLEIRKGYAYQFTAPAAGGTYYYGACVDAVADELITDNNCSDAVALRVVDGG